METRSISTADLAALLATTPKTIAAYANQGVVVRTGRGRFDEVKSVRGFARHMRSINRGKGGEKAMATVATERARLLKLQCEKIQDEIDIRAGRCVDADEMEAHAVAEWRKLQTMMLTLPTRVASRAGLTAAQTAAVDHEVRAVLVDMAHADYEEPSPEEIAACMALRLRRANGRASGKAA